MKKIISTFNILLLVVFSCCIFVGCSNSNNNNNNSNTNDNTSLNSQTNAIEDFEFKLNEDSSGYILTYYKGNDDIITIPDTYNNLPVVELGEYSFAGTFVYKVIFGKNIKEINDYAFSDCSNLISVTLSESLENIGTISFNGCVRLRKIDLLNVKYLAPHSFNFCSVLYDVTIRTKELYTQIIEDTFKYAKTIKVLKTAVDGSHNEYMEDTNNFTKTEDGDFYIFTKVV